MKSIGFGILIVGLAHGETAGSRTAAYTNVNGLVLGIEVNATSIMAGEWFSFGPSIIVSNASQVEMPLPYPVPTNRDTYIGDFVITSEYGDVLPKVLPYWDLSLTAIWTNQIGKSIAPGKSLSFPGNVVWSYSLTNAGKYYIKAVARVPATNNQDAMMIIETAAVEVTLTPRPEGSPAPPALYDEWDQKRFLEPGYVPKPERLPPRAQAPAPRDGSSSLPDSLRELIGASVRTDAGGAASLPVRPWYEGKLAYGFGVLALGAIIGLFAWHSRRKKPRL